MPGSPGDQVSERPGVPGSSQALPTWSPVPGLEDAPPAATATMTLETALLAAGAPGPFPVSYPVSYPVHPVPSR